jgi:hypothetical protein
MRATALLKPEANPVCRASTEFKTAVVRGATAHAIPNDMMRMAGRKVVQ